MAPMGVLRVDERIVLAYHAAARRIQVIAVRPQFYRAIIKYRIYNSRSRSHSPLLICVSPYMLLIISYFCQPEQPPIAKNILF